MGSTKRMVGFKRDTLAAACLPEPIACGGAAAEMCNGLRQVLILECQERKQRPVKLTLRATLANGEKLVIKGRIESFAKKGNVA